MRITAAIATATCLATLAVTTGCSGDDAGPKVLPTLSPTTSSAPTATPVEVPAAARARTPQGADAFVHFFFDEMNEAFRTSDGDRIRRLTNGECETCENYSESLDKAALSQEFVDGPTFRLIAVAAPPLQERGVVVDISSELVARRIVNGRGEVLRSVAAAAAKKLQVALQWSKGGWRVAGIRAALT